VGNNNGCYFDITIEVDTGVDILKVSSVEVPSETEQRPINNRKIYSMLHTSESEMVPITDM
jgi:hypothetical protein